MIALGKLTAEGLVKMQFGISKVTPDEETKELICLGEDWKVAEPRASFMGVEGARHGGTYCGINATIRSGPPDPPAIFIGKAIIQAPCSGSSSRLATFSRPGTFAPLAI